MKYSVDIVLFAHCKIPKHGEHQRERACGRESVMASAGGKIMSEMPGEDRGVLMDHTRCRKSLLLRAGALYAGHCCRVDEWVTPNGGEPPWWNWLLRELRLRQEAGFFYCGLVHGGRVVPCKHAAARHRLDEHGPNSLEVRVPFLGSPAGRVLYAAAAENKSAQGHTGKALLVAALEDLLPADVVKQTKRGFLSLGHPGLARALRSSRRKRILGVGRRPCGEC